MYRLKMSYPLLPIACVWRKTIIILRELLNGGYFAHTQKRFCILFDRISFYLHIVNFMERRVVSCCYNGFHM